MTKSQRRSAERATRCRRKRFYTCWDDAREAGLDVWRRDPRDPNPATPYVCDQPGPRHYHVGHLRFRARAAA